MHPVLETLEALRGGGLIMPVLRADLQAFARHHRRSSRAKSGRRRVGWGLPILVVAATATFVAVHRLGQTYPVLLRGSFWLGIAVGVTAVFAIAAVVNASARRRYFADSRVAGDRLVGVDGDVLWVVFNHEWTLVSSSESFDRVAVDGDYIFAYVSGYTAYIFRRSLLAASPNGEAILAWLMRAKIEVESRRV